MEKKSQATPKKQAIAISGDPKRPSQKAVSGGGEPKMTLNKGVGDHFLNVKEEKTTKWESPWSHAGPQK